VGVDPTSTGTLLRTAGDAFGVVTVHVERGTRSRAWTGRVLWTVDKRLTIGLVDTTAFMKGRAKTLRFRDVSRIDFGPARAVSADE
jgi:hypothetical protein